MQRLFKNRANFAGDVLRCMFRSQQVRQSLVSSLCCISFRSFQVSFSASEFHPVLMCCPCCGLHEIPLNSGLHVVRSPSAQRSIAQLRMDSQHLFFQGKFFQGNRIESNELTVFATLRAARCARDVRRTSTHSSIHQAQSIKRQCHGINIIVALFK